MTKPQSPEGIDLSDGLLSRIENRTTHTEFEDASAYVSYILEEVLHEVEENANLRSADEVDQNQVESRLKSLGYLDE